MELSQHDSAGRTRAPGPGGLGLVSKPRELVQSRLGRKGKFLQQPTNAWEDGASEEPCVLRRETRKGPGAPREQSALVRRLKG